MSGKTRIILEAADIIGILVRCSECSNEMVYSISEERDIHLKCTPCLEATGWGSNDKPHNALLRAIRRCGDSLRFEVRYPEPKVPSES